MDRDPKTTSYLFILTITNLILALAISFLVFDLKRNRVPEIDSLQLELNGLRGLKTRTSSIRRIVNDSRAERERLDLYFITRETTASFIEELESIARRSGVDFKLNSLNIQKTVPPLPKGNYLSVGIRTDGSFPEVFRFMKILENLPYRVSLNTVKLARTDPDSVGTGSAPDWYGEAVFDLISYTEK